MCGGLTFQYHLFSVASLADPHTTAVDFVVYATVHCLSVNLSSIAVVHVHCLIVNLPSIAVVHVQRLIVTCLQRLWFTYTNCDFAFSSCGSCTLSNFDFAFNSCGSCTLIVTLLSKAVFMYAV